MNYVIYEAKVTSGELSSTLTPGRAFALHEVRFHATSLCASGELAVTQIHGSDSAYNTKVYASEIGGFQHVVNLFDPHCVFNPADSLRVTAPNTNSNTYAVALVYVYVGGQFYG